MYVSFVIPGGWDYPDANAPWAEGYVKEEWEATSDRARIELTLPAPININADFNESWLLKFDIEPVGPMGDLGDLNVYGIDVSGAFGRTLIPCGADMTQNWLHTWYPGDWVPAIIGPSTGMDLAGGQGWELLPLIDVGTWGQIVCDDTRELNWNWGNVEWKTLTGLIKIALEVNSDTNLGEGFLRETEGGDKYPIKGGIYGFYIDNIELVSKPAAQ
jgi:hypothetical protein